MCVAREMIIVFLNQPIIFLRYGADVAVAIVAA